MTRPYDLTEDQKARPVPQVENDAGTGTLPWKGSNNAGYTYTRDGENVTLGAKADAPQVDPTEAASLLEILKGYLFQYNRSIDFSGAQAAIELEHWNIHKGNGFDTFYLFELAATTPQYLHLKTGAHLIHLKEGAAATNNNEIFVELLKDPVVALDVTPEQVDIFNSNGASATVPTLEIYTNSTITDEGTTRIQQYLPGADGQGQASSGGAGGFNWERILEPNSDYLIKAYRTEGTGTTKVSLQIFFYETPGG